MGAAAAAAGAAAVSVMHWPPVSRAWLCLMLAVALTVASRQVIRRWRVSDQLSSGKLNVRQAASKDSACLGQVRDFRIICSSYISEGPTGWSIKQFKLCVDAEVPPLKY